MADFNGDLRATAVYNLNKKAVITGYRGNGKKATMEGVALNNSGNSIQFLRKDGRQFWLINDTLMSWYSRILLSDCTITFID